MLTRKSLELLIDLVEIKLGSMEVFDRDDQKIMRDLEACRKELSAIGRPRQSTAAPSVLAPTVTVPAMTVPASQIPAASAQSQLAA
jgi:hypothetical protein